MKLTYDPQFNVAYLMLAEKTAQVETITLADDLNVDIGPNGTIYGIEFLNANEQLQGRLQTVNAATGKTQEVVFAP